VDLGGDMGHITLLAEIDIQPGKLPEFKAVVAEMVTAVQANEPGALRYDWYISEDGMQDWNVEVFADSDAVVAHMANVGSLVPKLEAVAAFRRVEVLGDLSPEGMAALGTLARRKLAPLGGIRR
jgi:quinol monooxygenase YgiN